MKRDPMEGLIAAALIIAAIWWKREPLIDAVTGAARTVLTDTNVLIAIPGMDGYGLDWIRAIIILGALLFIPLTISIIIKMIRVDTLLKLAGRGSRRGP